MQNEINCYFHQIDFNLANEKVANEWADWNTENYNMRVLFTVMGDLLDAPKTFCFSKEALESDEQVEEKKRKLKQVRFCPCNMPSQHIQNCTFRS